MNRALYLATKTGVVVVDGNGEVRRGLNGRFITSIIAREGVILAGTRDGIFMLEEGNGRCWTERSNGLTQRHVRWLAFHPDISDREFAGTEDAAIFVSQNGGASWQECSEVATLRNQFGWWMPYSSGAGCVRDFAFHGSRTYAAVEVGGLLRSDDGGQSWRLAGGSDGKPRFRQPDPGYIHADVHSVVVHPSSPDLVFAATAGGLFCSKNGGDSWTALRDDCYIRAVWVNPTDAQQMILGVANSPENKNGHICRSNDGGNSWQTLSDIWPSKMVERFVPIGTTLFALLSNGELLKSEDNFQEWRPVLEGIPGINGITTMY